MSHFNQSRLNERGIAPERERSKIVFNAGVDRTLVAMGKPCKTSHFKQAQGQYGDWRDKIENGDLIFTYVNAPSGLELSDTQTFINRGNSDRLLGIAVLNGQGVSGDTRDTIQDRINILGVAELSTKAPSPNGLYNVVNGGIVNVRNNGDQLINTNDTIIGWVPSEAQLARKTAGGTTRTAAEEHGVVKLMFMPYNASIHKNQPKQILNCLEDTNNQINYLPAYRIHCQKYMNSMLMNAIIIIQHNWESFFDIDENTNMETVLVGLLRKMGHSDAEFGALDPRTDDVESIMADRDVLRDKLFRPYSDYKRRKGQADARLFTGDVLNANQKLLNDKQTKAAFQFLDSTRYFSRHLEQHIVGEAKSTAEPGKDFTLQLKDYAR